MEHKEQSIVATYLRTCGLLHTCSLAGLNLSMGQLTKAKRAGYTAGTPDIMVLEPRGEYHGLLIEMKRKEKSKAKVSKDQKNWILKALARGYRAVVCYGAEEAIQVIEEYLAHGSSCKESVNK